MIKSVRNCVIFAAPVIAAALVSSGSFGAPAVKAKAKPTAAKKPEVNETKGQGQMAGGDGKFGTVYSLKSGWNEEILDAKYSVDPVVVSGGYVAPGAGEKLLVLDYAIKNARKDDEWFNDEDMISAVDQSGQQYRFEKVALQSDGVNEFNHTLKPGQGLGQPELHDPLRVIFKLPNKARVVKLIINQGRLNRSEDVLRFYIAGATAAEAGQAGDPKNVIAPLPDSVRDTSDPSGAIALDTGKGGAPGAGIACPSNEYSVTLDSFGAAPSDATIDGNPPDDGQKFYFATITLHNLTQSEGSLWDATGNGKIQVTDADGDSYDLKAKQKTGSYDAVRDDHKVPVGGQYTMRFVFSLPASATPKTFTYQADAGRIWNFDLSGR